MRVGCRWLLALIGCVAGGAALATLGVEAPAKVETPPSCLAVAGASAGAVADGLGKVESGEPGDRKAGAQGLTAIAKPAGDVAHCLLRNDNADLRLRGVHALAAIRDVSSTAALVALLADQEPRLRAGAAQALGAIGPAASATAVEPLIRRLGDSDVNVQVAAAAALGLLGDRRAVEPLVALLGQASPYDAATVAMRVTIAEDNGGQSGGVLDSAYKFLGYDPQATAALALEKLTKEKIGDRPEKWQEWLQKRKQGG